MMNTKDVELAFRADLQSLLNRYGAELEAKDHYQGYPECGQDIRMTVTIRATYDGDRDLVIEEWTEINLGAYLTADMPTKPTT